VSRWKLWGGSFRALSPRRRSPTGHALLRQPCGFPVRRRLDYSLVCGARVCEDQL